ncbi:hypothetical protein MNBD_CHLOROFLEXI01-1899 [hydrothermal vent metagenome]|uniref:DUF3352 domain-containing protein n=1 Tax=hydrothermal vent metagenome TaxID=652676 RepID=A0A3B0VGX7_9ZZZZ
MTEQTQVTTPTPSGGSNKLLIYGGIAALGLVAVGVIAAVFLIPKLLGADENAIASVMPPGTTILVELNALNLANEDAQRISRAFEDALDEGGVEFDADDPASFLEDLDDQLDDASGLTFTGDIIPWIGPNLGVGLIDLDIDAIDNNEIPQMIFAATIRDIDLADEFIENLIDAIEDETSNNVDDQEYSGVLTFEIDSDFDDERLAFARSDEMFFFASNLDTLEEAIDAQNGESLGDIAEYKDTISELPSDRAMTVYISGSGIEDFAKAAEGSGDVEGFNSDMIEDLGLTGLGFSATAIKEGIRIDYVGSYEGLTEEQQAIVDAQTDDIKTADFLPESTYMFIVGQRLDLIWQNAVEVLDQSGVSEDDIDEAMNQFDDMFGFDPSKDLIPLLDGEYSIAIIDSDDGALAEEIGADLGSVIMMGSSNGEELLNLAEDLKDGLEDLDMNIDDSSNDDLTVYEIEDPSGDKIAAYGISEDYLIVATSGRTVEDLFAGEPSLADSEQFKNAWDAFPRGTVPVMYIDVFGLLDAIEDLDSSIKDTVDVNPIYAIAVGAKSSNNMAQSTMIFFVEGD